LEEVKQMIWRKPLTVLISLILIAGFHVSASAQPGFILDDVVDLGNGTFKAEYTVNNFLGPEAVWDIKGKYGWEHGGFVEAGGPPGWDFTYQFGYPYWYTGESSNAIMIGSEQSGFWIKVTTPDITVSDVQFSTGPLHDIFFEGMADWVGPISFVDPQPIPTLSEWAMIIFAVVIVGLLTYVMVRRRRRIQPTAA
jgi:hypothetical protein